MHILEEPRPCADCGNPALKAYGTDNTPLCTTCQARRYRERAASFRPRATALTLASGERVAEDAWEPK